VKNKILLAVYCLCIVLIIILADLALLPLGLISRIPHYDWMAHLLLYGGLYSLLYRQTEKRIPLLFRCSLSPAFAITSAVIVLEEISQLFFESRTFSLADISMGFLGIGITTAVRSVVKYHQTERTS